MADEDDSGGCSCGCVIGWILIIAFALSLWAGGAFADDVIEFVRTLPNYILD